MAATQPVRLSGGAAAGKLVLVGGGFMPARLMVAPVGARLPPGVYAVAAVPATAVVAPGGRATHLLPRAAVPVPGPGEPAEDDGEGAAIFHDFIEDQARAALTVLDETVPPTAELAVKLKQVKTCLNSSVTLAGEGRPDKMGCALCVVRGSYAMLELVHDAYPRARLPMLPGEQAFVNICLAAGHDDLPPVFLGQPVAPLLRSQIPGPPEVSDADADLMKGVLVAVGVTMGMARSASDEDGSAGAAVCV